MLRKINGLVSKTFTLEQTSGFKLERNKDLTFIVIIIDIDWYENNYRDNSLGHIAQPYHGAMTYISLLVIFCIIVYVTNKILKRHIYTSSEMCFSNHRPCARALRNAWALSSASHPTKTALMKTQAFITHSQQSTTPGGTPARADSRALLHFTPTVKRMFLSSSASLFSSCMCERPNCRADLKTS